jgi:hypothetical protein
VILESVRLWGGTHAADDSGNPALSLLTRGPPRTCYPVPLVCENSSRFPGWPRPLRLSDRRAGSFPF